MIEPKFTPGPWEIAPYNREWIIAASWEGHLAETRSNLAVPYNDKDMMQTRESNAHLISAAPDLYAVVEELEESSCYWSEYDVPCGVVARMRTALAKARGELWA